MEAMALISINLGARLILALRKLLGGKGTSCSSGMVLLPCYGDLRFLLIIPLIKARSDEFPMNLNCVLTRFQSSFIILHFFAVGHSSCCLYIHSGRMQRRMASSELASLSAPSY
jgi:hypothetical protein